MDFVPSFEWNFYFFLNIKSDLGEIVEVLDFESPFFFFKFKLFVVPGLQSIIAGHVSRSADRWKREWQVKVDLLKNLKPKADLLDVLEKTKRNNCVKSQLSVVKPPPEQQKFLLRYLLPT